MHADTRALATFFLTGNRAADDLAAFAGLGLRPALFSAYRDLTRLRYDFPVVLVKGAPPDAAVAPLGSLIDRALDEAGGSSQEAERLHAHALRLEREVRAVAASGRVGSLGALLDAAATRQGGDKDAALAKSAARLRAALKVDGEVLDCSAAMPARVLGHLFAAVQEQRCGTLRLLLERLTVGLRNILSADLASSHAGRTPERLKASFGAVHREDFDFKALSDILSKTASGGGLNESRRRRIESTLEVLERQRFAPAKGIEALQFQFADCLSALRAFEERLPELTRLASAIAVAEMELSGEFNDSRHDALFEQVQAGRLDVRDMGRFPQYLVCMNVADLHAGQYDAAMQILSGGLPIKIAVQADDILGQPAVAAGHLPVAARNMQLANAAIGLNEVYVLQCAGSQLPAARQRALGAMQYAGPAVVSVFSGANSFCPDLPPYLVAAAAVECRAFPSFTYDPAAGRDWASRFSLEGNPQPEGDWPVHELTYEDTERKATKETLAFTLLDFMTCDARYASYFAKVPRTKWNGSLAPAAETLDVEPVGLPDRLPSLLMVDPEDRLQKVIVEGSLVRQARRCRDNWHSLQELAGIHNSHTERALAREREAAAKAAAAAVAAAAASAAAASSVPAPAAPAQVPAAPAAPAAAPAEAAAQSSDEAYIETPRCSTCEECVQINSRMFAYDDNKQAYIKDITAGTYRQLVEAAENCQVAIIHPGKPHDPSEPGLDELLKRAEPFL
jgi:hypothetical protein